MSSIKLDRLVRFDCSLTWWGAEAEGGSVEGQDMVGTERQALCWLVDGVVEVGRGRQQ